MAPCLVESIDRRTPVTHAVADLRQQRAHLDIAPGGHQQALQQRLCRHVALLPEQFPRMTEQLLPGELRAGLVRPSRQRLVVSDGVIKLTGRQQRLQHIDRRVNSDGQAPGRWRVVERPCRCLHNRRDRPMPPALMGIPAEQPAG